MAGLFSKPKTPSPPDPVPMPDPDDSAVKVNQLRQIQLARLRSGRLSTMLSGVGDETLG